MRKAVTVLLVLGLIVLGFSSIGLAYGGFGMRGPGFNNFNYQRPYWGNQPYNDNPLGLTEEQQEEFLKIQKDFFAKRNDLIDELRNKQYELRKLTLSDATEVEINKVMDEINSLSEQLNELRLQQWENLKGILTEEQLEKVKSYFDENDAGYYGFRGGFGRPGFGMRGWNGPDGFNRPGGFNRFYHPDMMGRCPWF